MHKAQSRHAHQYREARIAEDLREIEKLRRADRDDRSLHGRPSQDQKTKKHQKKTP